MPAPSQFPLPSYYDNLDATLKEAWLLLVRGAADRRAAFHTPQVASIGLDGTPKVRTVVLRHTDSAARTLRFHTDLRTAKVAEVAQNPHVQVLAYDPGYKIQLRISGTAKIHRDDGYAQSAWQRSQPQSQLCYRQDAAPGQAGGDPAVLLSPGAHDGQQNFAAVEISVCEIEWLYLAGKGHRRARFTWDGNGALAATWLAP
jgi:pyridoxamine 5'-phosphate oxidase